MLEQSFQQPPPQSPALSGIGDDKRELGRRLRGIYDIAPDTYEFLAAPLYAGPGKRHVASIVDMRHPVDPLRRDLEVAEHALVARITRKAANERFLPLAVVMADRPQTEHFSRGECPSLGEMLRIRIDAVSVSLRQTVAG